MEQLTGSFVPVCERAQGDRSRRLSSVEASFIENWGALARSFGMDPLLGRVHALAFLCTEAVTPAEVADTLGLHLDQAETYLEDLQRCGAVRESSDGAEPSYEANS